MPIRNYTSKMSPAQTAGTIQKLLAEHGAGSVTIDYNGTDAVAISFQMIVNGSPVWFRLEPDIEGMRRAMEGDRKIPQAKCTTEQAARTAWKNELDWLDAQLAKVAAGQARIEQLLLGYAVTQDGQTVWERLHSTGQLLMDPRRQLAESPQPEKKEKP